MFCKNLTDFFNEFKKYWETKKDMAREENYYDYVSLNTSRDIDDDKLDGVGINLEQGKVLIDIDISQIELKEKDWVDNYENKIEKVLKDIWTTGEIKDTYGLDLNWPANQQTSEQPKENDANLKQNSQDQKNKALVGLENQNQELQTKNEQLEKDKRVVWWIVGSLALVGLVGLIIWFVSNKKVKK